MKTVKTFKIGDDQALNDYLKENPHTNLSLFPESIVCVSETDPVQGQIMETLNTQLRTAYNNKVQAEFAIEYAKLKMAEPVVINPDEPVKEGEINWQDQLDNNENIVKTMETHIGIVEKLIEEYK